MKEQLTIHQFMAIEDLQIDLKEILVFIGSQASGKSTVSKAIFFFKSLKDDLQRYYIDCYSQNKFDNSIDNFAKIANQKFLKMYGSVEQSPEMRLTFKYGNGTEISIFSQQNNHENILLTNISFNKSFVDKFVEILVEAQNLYMEVRQRRDSYDEIHGKSLRFASSQETIIIKSKEEALFKSIRSEVDNLFGDDNREVIFIPAGRSMITTLSQQRYNIDTGDEWLSSGHLKSDNVIKLDFLMKNFIDLVDTSKLIYQRGLTDLIQIYINENNAQGNYKLAETIEIAQNLIGLILKGNYNYQNGIEKINFGKGKSTLINFASSGQQEVTWILSIILFLIIYNSKVFLVVEEPEAHLFPVAQKRIIDLIALLANQNDNQILLTTHSPYILSSFNNLLYAQKISIDKAKEVATVVDPHLWINPVRLDAYILEDGTARTIVDREIGLIESAEIDRASNIIVDTFNQLFDLED